MLLPLIETELSDKRTPTKECIGKYIMFSLVQNLLFLIPAFGKPNQVAASNNKRRLDNL